LIIALLSAVSDFIFEVYYIIKFGYIYPGLDHIMYAVDPRYSNPAYDGRYYGPSGYSGGKFYEASNAGKSS
jgi:hypothetical protein